jgi:predicted amidohydrolase
MKVNFKAAVVQLNSTNNKEENIKKAVNFIRLAAKDGAKVVSLPEYFNMIAKDTEEKMQAAEPIDGPTIETLKQVAREEKIYIHGGSFAESSGIKGKVYNTTAFINPAGEVIGTYRKIHLYDVDVPGGVYYKESDTIIPGDSITAIKTELAQFGLAICYDIRFPELFRKLCLSGVEVLFTPACFALYTGKDHWEPILRTRAIENQAYVIASGQFGNHPDGFKSFGNSMIIDPWGTVIARCPEGEGYSVATLSMDNVIKNRRDIPVFKQRVEKAYNNMKLFNK